MTVPLIATLGLLAALGLYFATISARLPGRATDHLDGGGNLPTWVLVFGSAGVAVSTLGLPEHLRLLATYGLQYNQIAVGLVVTALFAALLQKRSWIAARITGLTTAGDLLGAYFGSMTIRLYLLFILFLFSIPVAGYCLVQAGELVDKATGGIAPASYVIWTLAAQMFLTGVVGGWRGTVYWIAALSLLVLGLLAFNAVFMAAGFPGVAFQAQGIATTTGILPDRIPGVVQFTAGIGKELPVGGPFTAVAGLTGAISLIGIALSPGFMFFGMSTASRKGFAFGQVWMVAGLAAGGLALLGPVIAAELAASGPEGPFPAFAAHVAELNRYAAVAFLIMMVASLQIAVAFFAGSGASIVTVELVSRYLLPGLDAGGMRLAARIALAAIFVAAAALANFAPVGAAVFACLALSLAVQLLPAYLGMCWVPWISRSGVITGLILGTLLVVFTEPFGLVLFDRLFVGLPWGRWPLTIHSAAWGLSFNFLGCLLVSLFTREGAERTRRDELHAAYARTDPRPPRGAAITARWSLTLIWAFLAIGPGAILGNTFFSEPIFAGKPVAPGLPSLFIWQIMFWFLGVVLVWWLAYQARLSVVATEPRHSIDLTQPANPLFEPATSPWIARLLARVVNR